MMAVWCSSGALLLVLLTGVSHSYPAKKGFDPSTSYGGGHGVYPGSGGSDWEGSSHRYDSAGPVAGSGYETVSNPEHPPAAPHRQPSYSQPPAPREPSATSYSSNSFAAPARSGSVGNFYAGSAQPSVFQPTRDIAWEVPPPRPFSGDETSSRPGAHRVSPEASGPSNVSPPGPPPPPEFMAGEWSQHELFHEHGNSESESEEQGFQPPPPAVEFHGEGGHASELQPAGPRNYMYGWPWYMDYMFLTGQYPPGIVTHSSSSFEEGTDHWHDAHYVKDHYPAYPSTQQVQTYPADVKTPQPVKQPSQPVKQGFRTPSFGPSGASTGRNQPSGAVHVPGSYYEPSGYEQPRQPAGNYGPRKVGY